ncbi:MAG: quaternary ammonium compound efflux SMR transporter SugE [Rickettsiales bacterium]
MLNPWIMVFIAGLLEVCWAVGLKYTEGLTRPLPTALVVVSLAASMYLMARAMTVLPVGTAYAIWVGIGAFGAAAFGILLFDESASPLRLFFLAMLLVAIIGLKMTTGKA